MTMVEYQGKEILYTGDYSLEATRMHGNDTIDENRNELLILPVINM